MGERSILIVDDEAIVRESISNWLKQAGYEVVTAGSAEEALEMTGSRGFAAVILDVRLPRKTGLEVLRGIKGVKPEIKSIIISAYPTVLGSQEISDIDYLVRPVQPDDLERLIKEALFKCQSEN